MVGVRVGEAKGNRTTDKVGGVGTAQGASKRPSLMGLVLHLNTRAACRKQKPCRDSES